MDKTKLPPDAERRGERQTTAPRPLGKKRKRTLPLAVRSTDRLGHSVSEGTAYTLRAPKLLDSLQPKRADAGGTGEAGARTDLRTGRCAQRSASEKPDCSHTGATATFKSAPMLRTDRRSAVLPSSREPPSAPNETRPEHAPRGARGGIRPFVQRHPLAWPALLAERAPRPAHAAARK